MNFEIIIQGSYLKILKRVRGGFRKAKRVEKLTNLKQPIIMKNNRFLSIFLALVFLFSITTKQTQAKWDDKSDELPGMASNGEIIALAAVAAVGVGVLVYVLVKKNKNKVETTSVNYLNNTQVNSWGSEAYKLTSPLENKTTSSNLLINSNSSLLQKMETAGQTIPVDMVISPIGNSSNLALGNTNGIQVGIRIRF